MNQTKVEHYLYKFRHAKTQATLDLQADLADENNPDDHKEINEAWNTRFIELKAAVNLENDPHKEQLLELNQMLRKL